jgi:DNA modification methylase
MLVERFSGGYSKARASKDRQNVAPKRAAQILPGSNGHHMPKRQIEDRSQILQHTAFTPTVINTPIDAIFPHPLNPRVHGRKQIRGIAQSYTSFGVNNPILTDKNDRILAGHGRWEAAKLDGRTHVPVIRLEHLNEAQALAYMLADNKLSEQSSWNDGELALRFKELEGMELDFDIEATGFDTPEIDVLIQSLDPADECDKADEFESLETPAVTRPDDLWLVGDHRLLCQNALSSASYRVLMGSEAAAAVFTDPPWNVRVNGHAGGKGRKKHREFAMASGEMSKPQFQGFLLSALQQMRPWCDSSAVYFCCMDWRHIDETASAIGQAACELINVCVWVKSNGGMGSLYRSQHEFVFVFRASGEKHCNNVQLGAHGRNRTNVWNYPGMNSFARKGRKRALDLHPTVKPIALVADAILDVTRRGDIVLDPFCGSGTTILAAERTGRRGFGIEIDPIYVDLTIARWELMTKGVARHADGRTFAEVGDERAAASPR